MKMSRRAFLHLAAGSLAGLQGSDNAVAQAYPTRPVKIVVGYPAGGPIDIVARMVAQALAERLGQPFIVDNRPGAGGNVGAEAVVRAPADGYTLLLVGSNNFINATLYRSLRFNFIRDTEPVACIARTPLVVEVNPSVPATTIPEFIEHARARPGSLNMASGGVGTPVHMAGELFKMMTGTDMVHVAYRGSAPALADLIGGQVQVMFDTVSSSIGHLKAGKLRPLAVTTASRLAVLPDVPTVAEAVPGYEVNSVQGLAGPAPMPPTVVRQLHLALRDGLLEPSMQARFAELGMEVLIKDPASFGRLIAEETEKWARVVTFAGIRA